MRLYLDQPSHLTPKTAAARVQMPEDPASWSVEIMQEIYRQLPFISDFDIHVNMDRVDRERGYGFGHVEVRSKMNVQPKPEAEAQLNVRTALIPIIIREKELFPFDILVLEGGKAVPLTEYRLRQAMFRPNNFDVISDNPGVTNLADQLYPPHRQNWGAAGNGMVTEAKLAASQEKLLADIQKTLGLKDEDVHPNVKKVKDLGKVAATNLPNSSLPTTAGPSVRELTQGKLQKTGSVLDAIKDTIHREDIAAFDQAAAEPGVKEAFLRNSDNVLPSVLRISKFTPYEAEKVAEAAFHALQPDVVQVVRARDGYTVKAASRQCWKAVEQHVDRGHVVRHFGAKIAMDVDTSGSVTLAEGVSAPAAASGAKPAPIVQTGAYKVMDLDGKEITGTVFVNLTDYAGQKLPLSLFTNGSVSALQTDIVGVPAGELDLPRSAMPSGLGCFVNSSNEATMPVTALGTASDSVGNTRILVETMEGAPLELVVARGVSAITPTENGQVMLPADFTWLPLGKSGSVSLLSSEQAMEAMGKSASADKEFYLTHTTGVFSLRGAPTEKLASRDFLSIDDTLFSLVGLGLSPEFAAEKMAEAATLSAPVPLQATYDLQVAEDASAKSTEKLSSLQLPKALLLKEAADITDPMTVDTVLSLGFINHDNLETFLTYLPQFELSQTRLCELLLAARLGAQDIDASKLERTVKTFEDVIQSLKALAFQRN